MPDSTWKVVTVCGDPGGAAVLAPVLKQLQIEGHQLKNLSYNSGTKVLEKNQLVYEEIVDSTTTDWVQTYLSECDILLTATSVNEYNWERDFIKKAQSMKVPSLSVLDFWSAYGVRFELNGTPVFPDRLAVPDNMARQAVLKLNVPDKSVVATGQPALEAVVKKKLTMSNGDLQKFRQERLPEGKELLLVFASQPLEEFCGNHYGFTEKTVLKQLIPVLDDICLNQSLKLHMILRPHPRENPDSYNSLKPENFSLEIKATGDAHQDILASDITLGMNTILLLEACLLGVPVVSLQPGLTQKDPLPCNEWGASLAIYKKDQILGAFRELLTRSEIREQWRQRSQSLNSEIHCHATANIISELKKLWRQNHE